MAVHSPDKILVILGPTASGKSALAVELARRFGGEVISADSRQVYKGLDIGSGKITKREMRGVPHYMLDVASPRRTFTAAMYQRQAIKALRGILRRGKLPIICGGTGLYIDALLYRTSFPDVKPNPSLRKKLEKNSTAHLFLELKKKDPRRAATIDRHNKRRLIRALEIIDATGHPVPPSQTRRSVLETLKVGIRPSQAKLRTNIRRRLHARLQKGMVQEVKRLRKSGLSWKKLEALGLEYRYISRYLQGKLTKKDMIVQLEKEIHKYTKRQMTWFKRDARILWVENSRKAPAVVRSFLHNK